MNTSPEAGKRCWTLKYSDEEKFHADILPALEHHQYLTQERLFQNTTISITDTSHPTYSHLTHDWYTSNPKGYKKWFIEQMQTVFNARRNFIALNENKSIEKVPTYRVQTALQKAVQILKFHRDIFFDQSEEYSSDDKPISIIITTLSAKAFKHKPFSNLGEALANILGTIVETPISLSMHPPKVDERAYIEFPEPADITVQQMIDGHTALIEDLSELKDSVSTLEESKSNNIGYIGIGVGFIGIAIAIVAIIKSKRN